MSALLINTEKHRTTRFSVCVCVCVRDCALCVKLGRLVQQDHTRARGFGLEEAVKILKLAIKISK